MLMDLFEKNLKLLQKHDPALASRVMRHGPPENVRVSLSKEGLQVPHIAGTSLHSQYYPVKEAEQLTRGFKFDENFRTIVFGLGFGYHVLPLLQKGEVTVIEPLMVMFRAFISSIDLTPFLPGVKFRIAETPASLLARYEPKCWNIFKHIPSIRIGESYYQQLEKGLETRKFISNKTLKVLVVKPIYGGSLPTANYCVDALKILGHEVETVDCDKFADGFFSLKETTKIKANAEVLSQKFLNLMGEVTAAKAAEFRPDMILALAQAPLSPEAIDRLKELEIPVAFWFVEDFRALPYWKEVASAYDHFFTIQKDEFHPELISAGVKDCYYLPQAAHPAVHRPLGLSFEQKKLYKADISFMGAAYHNRVQSFPRLLNRDLKIWGTGWDLDSPLGKRVQNNNKRVTTDETVNIYNAAKINLNLHSSLYHYGVNPDGDFVNPRTFEISSCKGFQLLDNRSDLSNLFNVDEELVVFNSLDELKDQIGFYMANPDMRNEMASRSYHRVLAEHTIEHRMQELLIHVFINKIDTLKKNEASRLDPLSYCIEKAGRDTTLGKYLEDFEGVKNFSLKTLATQIHNGEGDLSDTETLLMMLDQLMQEKV
jgi:spore maturation protein CgeB